MRGARNALYIGFPQGNHIHPEIPNPKSAIRFLLTCGPETSYKNRPLSKFKAATAPDP